MSRLGMGALAFLYFLIVASSGYSQMSACTYLTCAAAYHSRDTNQFALKVLVNQENKCMGVYALAFKFNRWWLVFTSQGRELGFPRILYKAFDVF